jgi:tetratricopeptide (TPR) repeat protein
MALKVALALVLPGWDGGLARAEEGGEVVEPLTLEFADDEVGRLPALMEEVARRGARAFGQRDWEGARRAYREILEEVPDSALAHANLGAVEQGAGRMEEAAFHLERATQLNPQLVQSWVALGLVYLQQERLLLAVSALSRAVHEAPDNPSAHHYLGVALRGLGWTDGAEQEMIRAVQLSPEYADAHYNLALLYLERKPAAEELARRHYQAAVRLGAERDEVIERRLGL